MKFHKLDSNQLIKVCDIDKSSNNTPWSLYDYEESFKNPNHHFIGISVNDKLIGFCVYSTVLDEAEILQIVIEKHMHGHGYGYNLLNYICSILSSNNISQIFLEVMVGNQNAINLYNKLGFNIIGKRKHYYHVDGKSFDAILMAKTFFEFHIK